VGRPPLIREAGLVPFGAMSDRVERPNGWNAVARHRCRLWGRSWRIGPYRTPWGIDLQRLPRPSAAGERSPSLTRAVVRLPATGPSVPATTPSCGNGLGEETALLRKEENDAGRFVLSGPFRGRAPCLRLSPRTDGSHKEG